MLDLRISLDEFPGCSTKSCIGKLLPIEDFVPQLAGTIYFKGWFCPVCETTWMFNMGKLIKGNVEKTVYKQI